MKEVLVVILIFALVLVAMVGICLGSDALACNAKTLQIGFPHYYNILSGCMIEPTPGQWMPLANYRFVEQ